MLPTITKPLMRLGAGLACIMMLLLLGAASTAQAARIIILLSDTAPEYHSVADSIVATLATERKAGLDIQVISLPEWQTASQARNEALIVTVGVSAAQAVVGANPRIPVLATLIPKQAYQNLLAGKGMEAARLSALYLDQPFERQLSLLHVVLPQAQTFGVILGQQSQAMSGPIRSAAERFQLKPVVSIISDEDQLFPQLIQVLPQVDAMLAVPAKTVLNRLTIRNYLTATYRNRVPVIGYSQSQVEAGMLAAVFSASPQIGQQSGEMVQQILKGNWPAPAYPRYFMVKANNSVARSLGISLPDEEILLRKVRSMAEGD